MIKKLLFPFVILTVFVIYTIGIFRQREYPICTRRDFLT
jgi:hypothetical protein